MLPSAVVEWRSAPTVERCRGDARHRHPVLSALGPDILADPFDLDEVLARVQRTEHPTVAEVLLDQEISCGIGNIYKNESLFVRGIDPFLAPDRLPIDRWRALYEAGRRLMQRNLGPTARTTTGPHAPADFYVYGRAGRPCISCRTRISASDHGRDLPRRTWWCPRCQRGVGRRVPREGAAVG